jgi:hypothetical protein
MLGASSRKLVYGDGEGHAGHYFLGLIIESEALQYPRRMFRHSCQASR